MGDTMNHIERIVASMTNAPVDRLTTLPLASEVNRRLVGATNREYCEDPKVRAAADIAGWKYFGYEAILGLTSLSIEAEDLGTDVWFPDENTPQTRNPAIKNPEDYETLEVPEDKMFTTMEGRMGQFAIGTKMIKERIGKGMGVAQADTIVVPLVCGPLLQLTQSTFAEQVFMDMYLHPNEVHKALKVTTETATKHIAAQAANGADTCVMDYLWANYSVLGDKEYNEFEGDKYGPVCNKAEEDNGILFGIHSCADLPNMDVQVKKWKPVYYSYCHYPNIVGSLTEAEVILNGYADDTIMMGGLNPQMWVRATPEQMREATIDMLESVSAALATKGLNSRWSVCSGCEVPPALSTNMDNIKMMVDTVKNEGPKIMEKAGLPKP